ncbi:2-C-methyl-D-erythritol 4-phosphate cytidylyltransferase [uncultured Paludibacter sp.]|nr:2-C-methyl-D-erythritol 4-phosphate cytidylyltransferase [uncultured Paludibacter sp.]
MKQKNSVIVVAGGKGLRMNSDVPKQFLELCGKPVLMRTLERFHSFSNTMPIILVLPVEQIEFWKNLCVKYNFNIPHTIVEGGKERFFSVKNGLNKVTAEFVAIHDGVRPLVSLETIERCFREVEKYNAVIPVVDVIDSIRFAESDEISKPMDRTKYKLVQTPQVFRTEILKISYELPYSENFTDDASVIETAGYKVKLVEGNRENIKITTEIDLKTAESLLK